MGEVSVIAEIDRERFETEFVYINFEAVEENCATDCVVPGQTVGRIKVRPKCCTSIGSGSGLGLKGGTPKTGSLGGRYSTEVAFAPLS